MRKNWAILVAVLIAAMLFCPLMPVPVRAATPVISGVQTSAVTETNAVITWTTDTNATGNVEYGTSQGGPYPDVAPVVPDGSADNVTHGLLLFGLSSNTIYYYRVKSSDGVDPDAVSAEYSFETKAFTISGVTASSITDGSATITWSTSVLTTSNVEYGLNTSYGSIAPIPEDTTEDNTSHVVVLSGLSANTTYHYRVKCENAAGDVELSGDKTFDTQADATAPVISSVTSSGLTDNSATISWDTSEPATSQVEYGTTSTTHGSYDSTSPEDASLVTSRSVPLGGLLPDTEYYYRVISKDSSNNEAVSGEDSFTTAGDATAPVISSVASSDLTDDSATVGWDTNEAGTSQVAYDTSPHADPGWASIANVTAAYGSSIPEDSTLVGSHSVSLGGLLSNVTYYYRVISKDATGNEAWSAEYSFSTTADTSGPGISLVTYSGATATSVLITWSTDELADSQVEYGLDTGYGSTTTLDTVMVSNHSVPLVGLTPGATYHYRVLSSDAFGNPTVSADYSFTTAGDVTPPVITGLPVMAITDSTATIEWNTDEPADSQVEYGLTPGYGMTSPLDVSLVTNHSVVLTGLSANTTYHCRVISRDAATPTPNEGQSSDFTFTTTSDTVAPAVPTLLSPADGVAEANTSPALDWSDVLDPSGVTYNLQVDDDAGFLSPLVDETGLSFSSYILASTLADGVYYWKVKAVDLSSNANESAWSGTRSFVVDVTGPAVSLVALTPDPTTDNTPTFTGTATDAYSAVVAVQYRADGGSWTAASSVDGAFASLSEGYTLTTSALADGVHVVEVRAQDDLGNWTDEADYGSDGFTVDTASPAVAINNLAYHPATPLATPTFSGSATDATSAVASVEYRVLAADGTTVEIDWTAGLFAADPSDPRTGNYVFTTGLLAEGWHFLEVRAADAAGNVGTAEYNLPDGFCVTTKPLAKFDTDAPVTVTAPMWVTEDNRTRG